MPRVEQPKRSDSKPSPYPSKRPASAGPTNASTSSAALAKKERKKARRSLPPLGDSSVPGSGNLQSSTAGSNSDAPIAAPELNNDQSDVRPITAEDAAPDLSGLKKKKRNLSKKKRKLARIAADPVGVTGEASMIEEDAVPAVAPYPQPGALAVESTQDSAPLPAQKSKKRDRNELQHDAHLHQPNGSGPAKEDSKTVSSSDGKASKLERRLEKAKLKAAQEKAGWEKEKEEMAAKLKEAEEKLEAQSAEHDKTLEEKDKDISKNTKILETLREAASCGVCLDYLKDPHILACGHIACKACLTSWFRTPAAFLHRIQDVGVDGAVSTHRDVSYRTKLCHVCRVPIFRRPSRMYHFDSILEPLGINPQIPSLSQDSREASDPWRNIFPKERDSYRVHDDDGHIERCPECNSEIMDNVCDGCDIEFSESEDEGEIMSEGSEIGGGEDDDDDESGDDDEDDDGIHYEAGLDILEDRTDDDMDLRWARQAAVAEARADRRILVQARLIENQRNLMDLEASSDGEDDEEDEGEDVWGGGDNYDFDAGDEEEEEQEGGEEEETNMNDEMAALQRMLRHRGALSEDDDEEAEVDDASYDSSFIDDDADEEEVEVVEVGSGEEGSGGDDSLIVGEKGSEKEDDIGIDEMRLKRLARFGPPPAAERVRSESPVIVRSSQVGSSRRRVVIDSESE